MQTTRQLLLLLFFLPLVAAAKNVRKEKSLLSPDKQIELRLTVNSAVSGEVRYNGKVVIPQIVFSLEEQHQDFSKEITYKRFSKTKRIEEAYKALHGKRSWRTNAANQMSLFVENSNGDVMGIEFRVYNDGVCFRYKLCGTDTLRFVGENTAYRFDESAECWQQKYVPHYEGDYLRSQCGKKKGEWGYPLLVRSNGCWTLLTEADVDRDYCGTHLSNTGNALEYRTAYPHPSEGNGVGDVHPVSAKNDWHSPWRVLVVGELNDIVESTLAEDVCRPSAMENTEWIVPGSAAWVYWAYNHGTKDYRICCQYVDLAAKMGWEYVLFDWEWDQMANGGNLEDAVRYALSKGIKPWIWYNSGGKHNRVWATPRDRLVDGECRNNEFAKLKKMGFAGVKIDFFESDKQHMMNYYLDLLEDAAKHQLMINFHGCTLPRGWSRTYPHLMSMEGVHGAEQYNNGSYMTTAAARMNATFPFTRNVVGPMDYTPMTFTDSQHPHHTSFCHELALGVVFESAVQHWADRPEGFYALPNNARELMSGMPTAWDETRLVDGFPGEYVVMARRKGTTWYVAGINGTSRPKTFCVDVRQITQSDNFSATIFMDGGMQNVIQTEKRSRIMDKLTIKTLGQGGFVARLEMREPFRL